MHFRWTPDALAVLFTHLGRREEWLSRDEADPTGAPYPPLDAVITADGAVHVWVDMPGVSPEDINVYIRGDMLVIEGQKQSYYPEGERRVFLRVERMTTRFRRLLRLSYQVVAGSVKSELSDGVLHLSWRMQTS